MGGALADVGRGDGATTSKMMTTEGRDHGGIVIGRDPVREWLAVE